MSNSSRITAFVCTPHECSEGDENKEMNGIVRGTLHVFYLSFDIVTFRWAKSFFLYRSFSSLLS